MVDLWYIYGRSFSPFISTHINTRPQVFYPSKWWVDGSLHKAMHWRPLHTRSVVPCGHEHATCRQHESVQLLHGYHPRSDRESIAWESLPENCPTCYCRTVMQLFHVTVLGTTVLSVNPNGPAKWFDDEIDVDICSNHCDACAKARKRYNDN